MLEELIREKVRIRGSRGALAGELRYPRGETRFAALLVNPHPHMGGRTGNNVLVHLAETLSAAGGVTLCFDYGGVGESEGPRIDVAESMSRFWESGRAPEDTRLVEDVYSAAVWLARNARLPQASIGYSFGAYAATEALTGEVAALVLISPTVRQHDFSALDRRVLPKLILYGDNDFAASQEALEAWVDTLAQPKQARRIAGGEHFFRGLEDDVASACKSFLLAWLPRAGRERRR